MDNDLIIFLSTTILSAIVSWGTFQYNNGKTQGTIERLKEDVKEIKTKLDKINNDVVECKVKISDRTDHLTAGDLIQTNSPVTLSDLGKKIMDESSLAVLINSRVGDLVAKIGKEKPKTAYDVQEIAKKVLQEESKKEWFNPVKDYVFEKGYPLQPIVFAGSIYLRDIALDKLKFDMKDIDKYTPTHKQNSLL